MGPDAIGLLLLGLLGATAILITGLILAHRAAQRRYELRRLAWPVAADPLIEARVAALRDEAALALLARLRAGEDVEQEVLARGRAAPGQALLLLWLSHYTQRRAAAEALYDTRALDEIADALACVEVEASSAYAAAERLRRRWEAGEQEAVAAVSRLIEGLAMRAGASHTLPRGVELLAPTPAPHLTQLLALPYAALRHLPALCAALMHRDCFPRDGVNTSALLLASLQIDDPSHVHMRQRAVELCVAHGGPEHVATLQVMGARAAIAAIRARHADGGGELTLAVDGAEGGLTQVAGEEGGLSEVKGPR